MTIVCDCKVKENITTVLTPIHLEHSEGSSTNFDVIKCYNLVFSFNGKLNNIGFWILGILVMAHGPILIYYFFKGIKPVREYIINQMKKFGYIKSNKNNNKNKIIKNKSKNNKKRKKEESAPPLKNKNKIQIGNDKKTELIIKNLNIIDHSSSINVIKSTNRSILPAINHNKKTKTIIENKLSNENKKNKKIKKTLHLSKTSKKEINIKRKTSKKKLIKTKNITFLDTQGIQNNTNENEKNKNINSFTIMNIDLNISLHKNYIPPESQIIILLRRQ